MTPSIGRSIREGFRAANRSWAGIGFFAASWCVTLVIVVGGVVLTRPPKTGDVAAPAPSSAATQAPNSPETASPAQPRPTDEQQRLVGEWIGRAWPILLLCVLLFVGVSLWLYGGQLGYLAKRLSGEPTRVSEFWTAGSRTFGSLLVAFLLALLMIAGAALGIILLVWAGDLLSRALPGWLLILLGVIAWGGALFGLLWLGIRLVFWSVAVVLDRLSALAGFRASFRVTRGYGWKILGFVLLLGAINFGAQMVFRALQALGLILGGTGALALIAIVFVANLVAFFYLNFATLAAQVRYYQDAKSTPTGDG